MSGGALNALPTALVTVLTALLALLVLGASIPVPGGPLIVGLVLLVARHWVRRQPGRVDVASVLLAVAVLALAVQLAIAASYAVTGGSEQGAPVAVPSAEAG